MEQNRHVTLRHVARGTQRHFECAFVTWYLDVMTVCDAEQQNLKIIDCFQQGSAKSHVC